MTSSLRSRGAGRPRRASAFGALAAVAAALMAACNGGPSSSGVYLLIDAAGVDAESTREFTRSILAQLGATDSFAVARFDTARFGDADILASTSFDGRTVTANRQKALVIEKIKDLPADVGASPRADLAGALAQAVKFLKRKGPERRTILIFSKLPVPTDTGDETRLDLAGVEVIAVRDGGSPATGASAVTDEGRYRQWRARIEGWGGRWRAVEGPEELDVLLRPGRQPASPR